MTGNGANLVSEEFVNFQATPAIKHRKVKHMHDAVFERKGPSLVLAIKRGTGQVCMRNVSHVRRCTSGGG